MELRRLHSWQHDASKNLQMITKYPRAVQVLNNDFYVDDLLSGTSTIEDALNVQKELSAVLQTAGLTLRKWASNHTTFLDTIPLELQETINIISGQ